jgi:hypothetical protein
MKNLLLSFAVLSMLASNTRAGYVLGTSNPPGTPLAMSAGTTSGPMLVNIASDNPSIDIMAAWNFHLVIIADNGTAGTLSFAFPTTGIAANPPDYIFGNDGLGIAVTNTGTQLAANDFFDPSIGPGVSAAAANLLQLEFLASQNASGLFGIYAVEGAALTQWTDSSFDTEFFTNVPDGTGVVRIGDVRVGSQAIPEPASLALLGLGIITLAGLRRYGNALTSPLSYRTAFPSIPRGSA